MAHNWNSYKNILYTKFKYSLNHWTGKTKYDAHKVQVQMHFVELSLWVKQNVEKKP